MTGEESLRLGLPVVNLEGLGKFLHTSWPPSIASFTHSLSTFCLAGPGHTQHSSNAPSLPIEIKLSPPLPWAWLLHDPAHAWSSGEQMALIAEMVLSLSSSHRVPIVIKLEKNPLPFVDEKQGQRRKQLP